MAITPRYIFIGDDRLTIGLQRLKIGDVVPVPTIDPIASIVAAAGTSLNVAVSVQSFGPVTMHVAGMPPGLTYSNFLFSGTLPATVGTWTVYVTATNAAGTTTITFTIETQIITLADLYWDRDVTPYVQVKLLDQDITADVILEDFSIQTQLDYPLLNQFKSGNVSFRLHNDDAKYHPENASNFFVAQGDASLAPHLKQNGYGAKFEVRIGVVKGGVVYAKSAFVGKVNKLTASLAGDVVSAVAIDAAADFQKSHVPDFGIHRWMHTREGSPNFTWGVYELPAFMAPLSEESVAARSYEGGHLHYVEEVKSEGLLNPGAFSVKHHVPELRTEGGFFHNPIHSLFKEPWRYASMARLIESLAQHAGAAVEHVSVERLNLHEWHAFSHGRPGWATQWSPLASVAGEFGWDGTGKDLIVDAGSGDMAMLYGNKNTQNAILLYDASADTWVNADIPESFNTIGSVELWQIASADFETFYALGTQDGTYDSTLHARNHSYSSAVKIYRYVRSTDSWSIVADASNTPGGYPQLAMPYYDRLNISAIDPNFSLYPDIRKTFETTSAALYFRYGGPGGVDQRETGLKRLTHSGIFSTILTYYPHKYCKWSYDFILSESGNFIYHFCPDYSGTQLSIYSTSLTSNAATLIYSEAELNDGFFPLSVSDIVLDGDNGCWCVIQYAPTSLPTLAESWGQLCYIDFNLQTRRAIHSWQGFRNGLVGGLKMSTGYAYYFDGSQYAGAKGSYYRPATGDIFECTPHFARPIGRGWTSVFADEARVHNRLISRMQPNPAGEGFLFCCGFDAADAAVGYSVTEKAKSIENWPLVEMSQFVPMKVPWAPTYQTPAWELLTDFAKLSHTVIGFRNGKFVCEPRKTVGSHLRLPMQYADTELQLIDTRRFPDAGTIAIEEEVCTYSGISGRVLLNVTRAQHNSLRSQHLEGASVYLIDAYAYQQEDQGNMLSYKVKPDYQNIYNQIIVSYGGDGRGYIEDSESVAAYGELPLELSFPQLTHHERPWIDALLEALIVETKDLLPYLEMELVWQPQLEIGQTLLVESPDPKTRCWCPSRVLQITHDAESSTTKVIAKVLPQAITQILVAPKIVPISDYHVAIGETLTIDLIAHGTNPLEWFVSGLPDGVLWNGGSRISGTITQAGHAVVRVAVVGPGGSDFMNFNINVGGTAAAPVLTVIAGDERIYASWTAVSASPAVMDYEYRIASIESELAVTPWESLGDILSDTWTGLTNNVTYYVQMRAWNALGAGMISATVSATPMRVVRKPDPPTFNIVSDYFDDTRWFVELRTLDPTDTGNANIVNREADYSFDGGTTWTETLPDADFYPENQYENMRFRARIYNGTHWSDYAYQTTYRPDVLAAPPKVLGIAVAAGNEMLRVTWNGVTGQPPARVYEYRYATSTAALALSRWHSAGLNTETNIFNLTNGTLYYVQVRAVNPVGPGTVSDIASGSPTVSVTRPDRPLLTVSYPTTTNPRKLRVALSPSLNTGGRPITTIEVAYSTNYTSNTVTWTALPATLFSETNVYNASRVLVRARVFNGVFWSDYAYTYAGNISSNAVPQQVQGLTLTSDILAAAFTATWSPVLANPVVQRYEYQYADSVSGLSTATWHAAGTQTTVTVTGLQDAQTYYVRVRAVNSVGNGAASATGTVIIGATIDQVQNLRVTGGNRSITAVWDAVPNATKYQYKYATSVAGLATASWTDNSDTDVTITNLTNGTTYYVIVRGVNASHNGPASAVIAAKSGDYPSQVTGLSLSRGNGYFRASWTAVTATPAVTGYQYRYATTKNGLNNATWRANATTSVTVSGRTNGVTYWVEVRAVNAIGTGPASTARSVLVGVVPPKVSTPTLSAGQNHIAASWSAVNAAPSVTDYEYRYASSQSGLSTATWHSNGTNRSVSITALVPGNTYWVQVRAENAIGHGTPSTAASQIVGNSPVKVTNLALTAGNARMTLKYDTQTALPAITDYEYQRATTQSGLNTATVRSGGTTGNSFTVTGLTNNTTYYFRVRAKNSVGSGPWSDIKSATPINITAPGKPTNLGITNISATTTSETVRFSWTPPTDTGNAPLSGYEITYATRDRNTGNWSGGTVITNTNSTNNYHDIAISSGADRVKFTVRVYNGVYYGPINDSGYSSEWTIIVKPTAPTNASQTITDVSATRKRLNMAWTASSGTGGGAAIKYYWGVSVRHPTTLVWGPYLWTGSPSTNPNTIDDIHRSGAPPVVPAYPDRVRWRVRAYNGRYYSDYLNSSETALSW